MSFKQSLSRIRCAYRYSLTNHPYVTQGVQAGLMMGAGDVIAQSLIENRTLDNIDIRRTGQFAILGLCIVGPTLRFAYGFLDRKITVQSRLKRAVYKVMLDQLAFAPAFCGLITTAISAIQGYRGRELFDRVKNNYPDIMITNYCIWPAAQVINFSLVPLNYQVLYSQCIALGWNTYFSWKMSRQNDVPNDK